MINAIVSGIFKLITSLANLLVTPFITAILALFPQLEPVLSNITSFLAQMVTYVPLIIDLALIPKTAVVLLFDYFLIKYSVHLLQQAISFTIRIYNYFKL